LMNSATKLPYWHKGVMTKDDDHYWPLDFSQGAGVINALKAYDNLVAGMLKPGSAAMMGWDNNRLNEDSTINEYYIDTPKDKNGFINATLTWNMHYQDKYPFDLLEEKNSDLRLELWAIDPNDPAKQKLIDYSDSSMDNVEHIHFPVDANYSHYKIVVKFSDLAGSSATGQEKYAIAMGLFEKDPDSTIYQYDLNHDGVVNTIDFTILLNNISKVPHDGQFYIPGDINMDGQIDFDDLQILAQNRQKKASWVK